MNWMRIATVVVLASSCAFATLAQEFSAIGVARDTTGRVVQSNVYMSGGKVRTDPQETGTTAEQAYVILDLARRTATVVNVGQKNYMQKTASSQDLQFYASGPSPCPSPAAACKDQGSETINGRNVEKWEISQPLQGQTLLTRVWVDAKLRVWIKAEVTAGTTMVLSHELQNIQEGSQPASLFVIPAGFREMTLPQRGR